MSGDGNPFAAAEVDRHAFQRLLDDCEEKLRDELREYGMPSRPFDLVDRWRLTVLLSDLSDRAGLRLERETLRKLGLEP